LLGAAALLEVRAILDCADGELARAKKMSSPMGQALDGLVDWLCVAILYVGLWLRFQTMQGSSPRSSWFSVPLAPTGVLAIVLLQAALRSGSADYFKQKYTAIFETGIDATRRVLADKMRAARAPGATFLTKAAANIHWLEHLFFDLEWFRLSEQGDDDARHPLADAREAQGTRLIGLTWALSNGDTFVSMVTIAIACGRVWEAQLFFAWLGPAWILAVLGANGIFLARARRAIAAEE
jgi:hypothetical protein